MTHAFESTRPAACYLCSRPTDARVEVKREATKFTPAGCYVLPFCKGCRERYQVAA